jgi:hypothetical protein
VKVISLNEVTKQPSIQPNLDIGKLFDTIYISQKIILVSEHNFSMIYMLLKWHHIEIYNKNCREIDVLMRILVHLYSSAPTSIVGD